MKERRKLHSFCGLILQLLCHLRWMGRGRFPLGWFSSVHTGIRFISNSLWVHSYNPRPICGSIAGSLSALRENLLSNPWRFGKFFTFIFHYSIIDQVFKQNADIANILEWWNIGAFRFGILDCGFLCIRETEIASPFLIKSKILIPKSEIRVTPILRN